MSAPPPPYSTVAPPPPRGHGDETKNMESYAPYGSYPGWQVPPPAGSSFGTNTYQANANSPPAPAGYDPYKNNSVVVDDDLEAGRGSGGGTGVGFASASFSDVSVRAGFIRKVYFTLSVQLAITFAIVAVFVLNENVKKFIQDNFMLYYVGYAFFLVTYFVLICCEAPRRKYPANIVLLLLFTLAFSYMVGTISSFYNIEAIMLGLGITTGVTLSVSLFACQTKFDFTKWIGVAVAVSFCLFFFGIFCIFFYSRIMSLVYACIGAVLFTVFLAIDTQMIVGGKRHEISPEEHILGAIMLYMDIMYIFLFILQIVGRSGD